MSVKDKSLYPPNWQELATQIKESDNWYCVNCRRPCRRTRISKQLAEKQKDRKIKTKPETVDEFKYRLAVASKAYYMEYCEKPQAFTLTVSHQDHDVTNNIRTNLKSLCSVCHLRYDAAHHVASRLANAAAIVASKTVKAKTTAKSKTGTAKPKKTSKKKNVKK